MFRSGLLPLSGLQSAVIDLELDMMTELSWAASAVGPVVSSPRSSCQIDYRGATWRLMLAQHAFPPVSLLALTLCKVRKDKEQVLLVAPL